MKDKVSEVFRKAMGSPACQISSSFRSSPRLSSFIQLGRSVVPSGGPGAGSGRGCARRAAGAAAPRPGGEPGRRPPDGRAGPRSAARASGRTGPGGQCAFVYVARAAAANMHLKSPRVSARQRPAAQSLRRRAPRTPGRRSLWYISDLTSRAGQILRWEPFWVHLGSQLGGGFWGFVFFSERGVTSPLRTAQPAEQRHLTHLPKPPRQRLQPGSSHVGEGATKSLGGREPWCGPGSRHLESRGWVWLAAS